MSLWGDWPLFEDFEDKSGNNNHLSEVQPFGTSQVGLVSDPDKGTIADFIDTGYLTVTVGALAPPFSLLFWAKSSEFARDIVSLGDDTGEVADRYWKIRSQADPGALRLAVEGSEGSNNLNGSTAFADGNWHHVAMVVASSTSRILYIDGVSEGEATTDRTVTLTSSARLYLGQGIPQSAWAGQAFGVQLWTSVVAPASVASIMNLTDRLPQPMIFSAINRGVESGVERTNG